MTLFRQAAIDGQRRLLHGDVTIHQPLRFQALTISLLIFTVLAGIGLLTASFVRKESAAGWIVPEKGIAEAYAPSGAVIQTVNVRLGERVVKGQILASISTETYDAEGAVGERESQQIALQIAEVDSQILAARARRLTASTNAIAQRKMAIAAIKVLKHQRFLQSAQLKVAIRQFEGAAPLLEKGFVSKFDQDRREQAILSLEQALGSIDQQIAASEGRIADVEADLANAGNQQVLDESQLRSARAVLMSSSSGVASRSRSTIRASTSGEVIAINTRSGETAKPGLPLIVTAPDGPLSAEILLPTRASGFVKPGQSVRLFIDAFPFQRYGALNGTIEQMSRATVKPGEYGAPIKFDEASYRVLVKLPYPVNSGGLAVERLRPGMTLTASIATEKRTAMQWLFDSIFAARAALAG